VPSVFARRLSSSASARIPFEVPGPDQWVERLDAVLSTLEVAYAKAHEDVAGSGAYAHYATEILALSETAAALMPLEPDALAIAALIRLSEARRPARVNEAGEMVPLSDQDPRAWKRTLIDDGLRFLNRAIQIDPNRPRVIQAQIHGCWCRRGSLAEPLHGRKFSCCTIGWLLNKTVSS